jgi:hypothetical protein
MPKMTKVDLDRLDVLLAKGEELITQAYGKVEYYNGAMHTLVAFNQGYSSPTRDLPDLMGDTRISLDLLCQLGKDLFEVNFDIMNILFGPPDAPATKGLGDIRMAGLEQFNVAHRGVVDFTVILVGPLINYSELIAQSDKFEEPVRQLTHQVDNYQPLSKIRSLLEEGMDDEEIRRKLHGIHQQMKLQEAIDAAEERLGRMGVIVISTGVENAEETSSAEGPE